MWPISWPKTAATCCGSRSSIERIGQQDVPEPGQGPRDAGIDQGPARVPDQDVGAAEPEPVRHPLQPVAQRAGGQRARRPRQPDERRRQHQDDRSHGGQPDRVRPGPLGHLRPLPPEEVLPQREDRRHRQHQPHRLPRPQHQVAAQADRPDRRLQRPKRPLRREEPPEDQPLGEQERQQDQGLVDEDHVPQAEARADDPRPAHLIGDPPVEGQRQDRDDPPAERVETPDRRGHASAMRHPDRHQTPQAEGDDPDDRQAAQDFEDSRRDLRSGGAAPSPVGVSNPNAMKRAINKENDMSVSPSRGERGRPGWARVRGRGEGADASRSLPDAGSVPTGIRPARDRRRSIGR